MNNLQRAFQVAGNELALAIDLNPSVTLKDGTKIVAEILVKDFGGPQGMLVFSSSDIIWNIRKEISSLGYGYSVMSIPAECDVDMASCKEVLIDWGWSADSSRRPTWVA